MSLLEIKNLTVEFETVHGVLRAVDEISLSVDAGEIVSIVGESGSGKSVAMLALMGLLPWTAHIFADVLYFDGHDMLNLSSRDRRHLAGKSLSMIFQEPMSSLNPCFTIGFQLTETLRTHLNLSRKAARLRAIELLETTGIPEAERRMGSFPHQLSGGMNQRVMIALAISCNPRLLIADEPTTALDVTIQAQILQLLLSLQEKTGMALLLITHDMGIVAETAHRVIVQYCGQQVEEQSVGGLFSSPRHPYTHALLSALPERSEGDFLGAIEGTVPGQFDRPRGCLFAPRCTHAQASCHERVPKPTHQNHRMVRCHYPL